MQIRVPIAHRHLASTPGRSETARVVPNPPRAVTIHLQRGLLLFASLLLAGCSTLGPASLAFDRFNYNKAGARSANEQLLLNIVRLRYGEPVYWVEIGSMLSQYTFEAGAQVSGWENDLNVWKSPALRAATGVDGDPGSQDGWGANVRWTDRPTITYAPLQGEDFAKRIMTPIPAATVLYLSQSGWSINRVMECCVQQLNDIQNRPIHDVTAGSWITDVRFRAVSALLKKVQDAGHLQFSLELSVPGDTKHLTLVRHRTNVDDEEVQDLSELLGVDPSHQRLKIIDGGIRRNDNEMAIQTRSLLGTMYALAQDIPAPPPHLRDGQIRQIGRSGTDGGGEPWLRVGYSKVPVKNTFAQVYYHGYWFYLPNNDWRSKRTFALLTYLFSLQASESTAQQPIVTVPAG